MRRVPISFSFFIFYLLLIQVNSSYASNPGVSFHPDTSKITVKQFNSKALDSLRADKDFDYGPDDIKTASLSWWTRLWTYIGYVFAQLWDATFGRLGRLPHGGSILKYTLLLTAVILLIYIIIKATGLDPAGLLRGRSKKLDIPFSESLEDIYQINFDTEIEKAAAQHNYRLAVRLLYLKCLRQLSDGNLIKWEINKTNAAYVYELANPVQKQSFGALTRQFEYAWYGNFPIDQQAYGGISQLFHDFKKQLQ